LFDRGMKFEIFMIEKESSSMTLFHWYHPIFLSCSR
jgi:hypothetical protein